jgi:hypothetical protein
MEKKLLNAAKISECTKKLDKMLMIQFIDVYQFLLILTYIFTNIRIIKKILQIFTKMYQTFSV